MNMGKRRWSGVYHQKLGGLKRTLIGQTDFNRLGNIYRGCTQNMERTNKFRYVIMGEFCSEQIRYKLVTIIYPSATLVYSMKLNSLP